MFDFFHCTKQKAVNKEIIHFMSIHTPIHDMVYSILLLLSVILGSLRLDNIISIRYVYVFIPALLAFTGWTIKG